MPKTADNLFGVFSPKSNKPQNSEKCILIHDREETDFELIISGLVNQANIENSPQYLIDAAIMCHNAINMFSRYSTKSKHELIKYCYSTLDKIRMNITTFYTECPVALQPGISILESQKYQSLVNDLRSFAIIELNKISTDAIALEHYTPKSSHITSAVSSKLRKFLANLYEESEKELLKLANIAPICKYSVMALGSLALDQATPFSDLEFAILHENTDDIIDRKNVTSYFTTLTILVQMKVINIGETTLPHSRYVNFSDIRLPGICFDLGGKTPLGRHDRSYSLINTIQDMLSYIKYGDYFDNNLSIILEAGRHVFGDETLTHQFQHMSRKLLEEEVSHNNHTQNSQRTITRISKAFSKFHDQQFGAKSFYELFNESTHINAKEEIYRPAERLIFLLSQYCQINIEKKCINSIIENLYKHSFINIEAKQNLLFLIDFANIQRMKAVTNILSGYIEVDSLGSDKNNFVVFFYILMGLYQAVVQTIDNNQLSYESNLANLKNTNFMTKSYFEIGLIKYKLGDFESAASMLDIAISNEFTDLTNKKYISYSSTDEYEIINYENLDQFLELLIALYKLGICYINIDQDNEALSCHARIIQIMAKFGDCPIHKFKSIINNTLYQIKETLIYKLYDLKDVPSDAETVIEDYLDYIADFAEDPSKSIKELFDRTMVIMGEINYNE